jgi:hypothetical protein
MLSVAVPALLAGCRSPTAGDGSLVQRGSSYINFYAFWGDVTPTPAVVKVSIYRAGSTIPEETRPTTTAGYFYSTIRYDTSADYEVYLHYAPTAACVATTIISFHSSHPWLVEEAAFGVTASIPAGPPPPNNNALPDCKP